MKNLHIAGLLTLAASAMFFLGFSLAWFTYPLVEGEQWVYVIGGAAIFLIGIGYTLSNFIQAYVLGTRRLAEETQVIMAANPSYRVSIDAPSDIRFLGKTINSFADRFQSALDDQTTQIEQAQAQLEEEKNRLAALMSELSEGVLVCNLEGQILLYNHRARQLLKHEHETTTRSNKIGGYVGLGRSVFGLIDRNTITHVLEDLTWRGNKNGGTTATVSQVVIAATNGQLIRTRTAPILNNQDEINGFVLTLEDVTYQSHRDRRRDKLLQALTEGVRASLANIRTAIETIEQFPQMEPVKLGQLRGIIYDEALTLSNRLNQITSEYDTELKSDWQLEEMIGNDLLWAIQHRFEKHLGIKTKIIEPETALWLRVDSYSVVHAMQYIMNKLRDEFDVQQVQLDLKPTGQLAALDLAWDTTEVDMSTVWGWQNEKIANSPNGTLTLRDVAERHGGEVWCQTDKNTGQSYLRLLLSTTTPKPPQAINPVQGSRPEYYDFDLFHQPGQNPKLDNIQLKELSYTVFDTETTGLNPSSDEIISVSAVRIVNNRLLRQEIFDQLVDPQRPLSVQSTNITGISQDMLKNQPTIEQVLPSLQKFAEGTVLIAHNAAFDMRMLQIKEAQTGIKFTNPVLDTLLLSAVTHANHKDHSLEAIAERLGINIIGRHTSLGDAILTGEVFLKLVPLLAERGIYTLAEARNAAQKTYQARIKY